MNGLILDAALVIMFTLFTVWGIRQGIIKSFLSFILTLLSIFFAVYFAGVLSHVVYLNFIEPAIIKEIQQLVLRNNVNLEGVLNKIPAFILNLLPSYGITSQEINRIINNSNAVTIPREISKLFSPMIINVLKTVFTFMLFIIFILAGRLLAKVILKLFKIPGLRQANGLLGGIFGLCKCYIIAAILMCGLNILGPDYKVVPRILSQESIDSSFIFKGMYRNNLVYGLFKKI